MTDELHIHMPLYRKRPIAIEAAYYDGSVSQLERIASWAGNDPETEEPWIDWCTFDDAPGKIYDVLIHTLEGDMTLEPHSWVIRGVKGEFYACRNDIFLETYEIVADGR